MTSLLPTSNRGSKLSQVQELRAGFREQILLNLQLRQVLDSALLICHHTTLYLSTGTSNVNFRANIHIFKPSGGFRVQATQSDNRAFLCFFISLVDWKQKILSQILFNLKTKIGERQSEAGGFKWICNLNLICTRQWSLSEHRTNQSFICADKFVIHPSSV